MTDAAIDLTVPTDDVSTMRMLRNGGPMNAARIILSSHSGKVEQAMAQRRPPSMIEVRRMEFEAVAAIAKALGLGVRQGEPA